MGADGEDVTHYQHRQQDPKGDFHRHGQDHHRGDDGTEPATKPCLGQPDEESRHRDGRYHLRGYLDS